jgi:hypothetical protein
MLQYAGDFQGSNRAENPRAMVFEGMDRRVDPATGLWGNVDLEEPVSHSEAIQAAYHFWLLYFYEKVEPPHIVDAIDWILATQNPRVHVEFELLRKHRFDRSAGAAFGGCSELSDADRAIARARSC